MTLQTIFALLSAFVAVASFVPYIRDIFRLKTTPHSYSWLMWAILQGTTALVMVDSGAGVGVASVTVGASLCTFVFLLSLRYGTKNITRFDTVCLAGALFTTSVWFIFHDGLLAIILVSLIDLLAFLPTFRKAYEEPYSETTSTYFLSGVSDGLALFALVTVSVTTSLYLVTLVITNFSCLGIILFRRARVSAPLS
ncbi:MAG: hypothetical protein Q7R64_02710 [bacterium]|nr:hypothetical protein [bacterium]